MEISTVLHRAAYFLCAAFVLTAAACSSGSKQTSTPTSAPATSVQTQPGGAPAASTAPRGLSVPDIVEELAPSIVRVQTESATLDVFGRTQPSSGVGTGVIIDTDGHIVTNNHVVTLGTADTPP